MMKLIAGRDPQSGKSIEVAIEHGRIAAIRETPETESGWLSAGLIDLQINGYGGLDFNGEGLTSDTVIELARRILAMGVTTFLPTLITAPEERILVALGAIAEARKSSPLAAHMIPGVHVEGPHISPEIGARGAHPREHIRPPSLTEFKRWQSACDGLVRVVTMSPHFDDAPLYIAALRAQGVHVSIGHTHCSADHVRAAVSAGADLSTHLGNGVADPLPRHPNLLWAQLAEDKLTATFIADGHHLPMDTLSVMLRAKGMEHSILISDAVALAGMPPGQYRTPVGGEVELNADGRLNIKDSAFLAGAVLPLKDGVAYLVEKMGLPLADALRLASVNPGRYVSDPGDERGALQVGSRADLIRFDITDEGKFKIDTALVMGSEWN
jgi:N-acetylglucosamine-6-phosphate deacetylase